LVNINNFLAQLIYKESSVFR